MNNQLIPDFDSVLLDRKTIPQERLNIDCKERSNLLPWSGQFSPQLVEVLLQTYSKDGDIILDPFLGSGTVLHEAGRLQRPAFGVEINPAAYQMATTYRFINLKKGERKAAIAEVDDLFQRLFPDQYPLFSFGHVNPAPTLELEEALVAYRRTKLNHPLAQSLLETLIVLLNYGASALSFDSVAGTWAKIRELVLDLPFSAAKINLKNCDARAIPLPEKAVGCVITSPPYLNVFNYHQQYRRSMEALGWNLLVVAKSEIGSNRKNRGNRFLSVIQYCLDMTAVFAELRRVCKVGTPVIVVVGRESNVRKTTFFNGEIVAALAVRSAGYFLQGRQERVFTNRFGERIYEDILHLTPAPDLSTNLVAVSDIAREILFAAKKRAPQESMADLEHALQRLEEVKPSPLYVSVAAQDSSTPALEKRVI
jgi:DNA modification methylase